MGHKSLLKLSCKLLSSHTCNSRRSRPVRRSVANRSHHRSVGGRSQVYHGSRAVVVVLGPEIMPIDLRMACEGRKLASMSWCSQKSGGDIGMVSVCVRASVCPWFPTIIWKNNHSIHFKFSLGIFWVSVQNWFAWPNFGPLKNYCKWAKMVVSDHYLKKYSCNPFQTWCVHLLGECPDMICFLARLAEVWPSSGHKMTENGSFRPLSERVFTQTDSNMLSILIEWMFRIDLLFAHVGQILAL